MLYILPVTGLEPTNTGVWGKDYPFLLQIFWKEESEEVILLINLETKKVSWKSEHYLEGKFLAKHSSNQAGRGNSHLQDGLKLNSNILEPLVPKWGWETAILRIKQLLCFFRWRIRFLRLGLFSVWLFLLMQNGFVCLLFLLFCCVLFFTNLY